MTTTSASSPAPSATVAGFAASSPAPPPAGTTGTTEDSGFATIMAQVLDPSSAFAKPGRDASPPPAPAKAKPSSPDAPDQDDSADALLLAGMAQAWATTSPPPVPPAPQLKPATEVSVSDTNEAQAAPARLACSPPPQQPVESVNLTKSELTKTATSSWLGTVQEAAPSEPPTDEPSSRPTARQLPSGLGAELSSALPDSPLPDSRSPKIDAFTLVPASPPPAPSAPSAPPPCAQISVRSFGPQQTAPPQTPAWQTSPPQTSLQQEQIPTEVSPTALTMPSGAQAEVLAQAVATSPSAASATPAARPAGKPALPVARLCSSAAEAKFVPEEPEQPDPQVVPEPTAPLAGTGDAQLADGVKKSTETKQFAGPAQQNLPDPAVASQAASGEPVRRGGARLAPARDAVDAPANSASQLLSLLSSSQPGFRTGEELGALPAPVAATAATPADVLQSTLLKQVSELRHTGATEMSVVLKPDSGTELSLRLSLAANGEVSVQARCDQGDGQLLAANWGEIRDSLAQQGVRLGALEFTSDRNPDSFQSHAGSSGPSADGQSSSQRHASPQAEPLDELPLAASPALSSARRSLPRPLAGATRSWEFWA